VSRSIRGAVCTSRRARSPRSSSQALFLVVQRTFHMRKRVRQAGIFQGSDACSSGIFCSTSCRSPGSLRYLLQQALCRNLTWWIGCAKTIISFSIEFSGFLKKRSRIWCRNNLWRYGTLYPFSGKSFIRIEQKKDPGNGTQSVLVPGVVLPVFLSCHKIAVRHYQTSPTIISVP